MKHFIYCCYLWLLSGLCLGSWSLQAATIWLEHQTGQPWQQASADDAPLAMHNWLLGQQVANWPARLEALLQQNYCAEGLAQVGTFATNSHFLLGEGQVLLSQQMQRQLAEPGAMQAQPWLRLSAEQAKSSLPVYVFADRERGYVQSVMVPTNQAPQTLWQFAFMPPHADADSVSPLVMSTVDTPRRQSVLVLPARNQFGVQLLDPSTGRVLPFGSNTSGEPLHASAMPATLDTDLNGALDRIYQITDDGLLYRLHVQQNLQVRLSLVADLRQSGWQYTSSLTASRSRWPLATGWQVGDVLMIQAKADQRQQLLVLKIPENNDRVMQYQELSIQSLEGGPAASPVGWRLELSGHIAAMPSVMAGVLYLPLADSQQLCAGPMKMDKLLAVHLYYGNAVYPEPLLSFSSPVAVKLSIAAQNNALTLMTGSQAIVPRMLGVRGDCAGCSEVLLPTQFPKWQRIASYQPEQGAY